MQQFDDLTTAVNNLIAADEAENTILATVLAQLNTLLANPLGVNPTDVTALRDKVAAELAKVNAAIASATPTAVTFTVGGGVSGLTAGNSVTLLNNGVDALTVSVNGPFVFVTPIATGSPYAVTVGTQPAGQVATVTNGSGAVAAAVTNVTVVAV